MTKAERRAQAQEKLRLAVEVLVNAAIHVMFVDEGQGHVRDARDTDVAARVLQLATEASRLQLELAALRHEDAS